MYRINIGVHQVISCTIHHPSLASSTDWQIDRLIPVDVPLVCCWLLVWQHKAGIQGRGRHDWFAGRQHSDTLPAFTVSRSVSFQSCLSLVLLSVCCLHWSLHLYSCTSEASPWMQCDTVTARKHTFPPIHVQKITYRHASHCQKSVTWNLALCSSATWWCRENKQCTQP